MADKMTSVNLNPIRNQSLREQAKAEIQQKIINGDVEPGKVYRTSDFVEQLQVSATPVREALLELTKDGLVEMLPNRGFQVPVLTDEDLDELFYLRVLLEAPSVARATKLLKTQEVEALWKFVRRTVKAAENQDLHAFIEWDSRFHLGLLAPLRNKRLIATVGRLRDESGLYRISHVSDTELLDVAAAEHEKIMHAVGRGDSDAAGELMRYHLEHTIEMYKYYRNFRDR